MPRAAEVAAVVPGGDVIQPWPAARHSVRRRAGRVFALAFTSIIVAGIARHADAQGGASPSGGTAFDGQYYSPEFRYGFRLDSGTGTATVSNSPSYRPGDTILRYRVVGSQTFIGQQIATDG
jgi:hypothetical protein